MISAPCEEAGAPGTRIARRVSGANGGRTPPEPARECTYDFSCYEFPQPQPFTKLFTNSLKLMYLK